MLISERKFKQVFPSAIDGIYAEIAKHIEKAGCKTKEQQAMFLAQCGVECAGYKTFEENLNYSATALLATFPKYFTQHNVVLYAQISVRLLIGCMQIEWVTAMNKVAMVGNIVGVG